MRLDHRLEEVANRMAAQLTRHVPYAQPPVGVGVDRRGGGGSEGIGVPAGPAESLCVAGPRIAERAVVEGYVQPTMCPVVVGTQLERVA